MNNLRIAIRTKNQSLSSEVNESPRQFAIIIGAMKSGTTTLFEYLRRHPEISEGRRKELNFFQSSTDWKKGQDHYARLWPRFDAKRHRYALEASPSYAKAPYGGYVAPRIWRFGERHGAEFRFIYIVRDPIDRIESQIAHNIGTGRADTHIGWDHRMFKRAINVSRYAFQLDTFRAGFPKARIQLIDFDELRRDPLAAAARCARFLQIDPVVRFDPLSPANTRSPANGADTFRLSGEDRARLAELLREDVRNFRDRHGFDVAAWNIA